MEIVGKIQENDLNVLPECGAASGEKVKFWVLCGAFVAVCVSPRPFGSRKIEELYSSPTAVGFRGAEVGADDRPRTPN